MKWSDISPKGKQVIRENLFATLGSAILGIIIIPITFVYNLVCGFINLKKDKEIAIIYFFVFLQFR